MSASRPVSIALVALLALAAPALGQDPPAPPEQPAPPVAGANPCLGPLAPSLRCPDLVMHAPYNLRIDRRERPGRVLLRAANSIDSVGTGPVELRGRRDGRTMAVTQRIHRSGGAPLSVPTRARLGFYPIPGQSRYWKSATRPASSSGASTTPAAASASSAAGRRSTTASATSSGATPRRVRRAGRSTRPATSGPARGP